MSLRKTIQDLRCKVSGQQQYFIPHQLLYKILTKSVILDTLKACPEVRRYHLEEIAAKIYRGGRRTFAVLVLLKNEEKCVIRFLEHDQFQRSSLDSRLPFPMSVLKDVVPSIATDFFEAQWELSAPVFSRNIIHRYLNDGAILPFLENTQIADSGFGTVFKVHLHSDHCVFHNDSETRDVIVVRKQIKRFNGTSGTPRDELHNLSLLNELKHPYILELLSSYTFKDKHNFLFPFIRDGNLASFLSQSTRQPTFKDNVTFFVALGHLSSAIEAVHNFTCDKLELELIGCHHDLKPDNILIRGSSFILADFGLSTFKEINENSQSLFREGAGHYLAPECEDYEDNFAKHMIGRSSDMWSFGCIISEVLTYMLQGREGVSEFKLRRQFKVRNFRTYTFHAGRGTPNKAVGQWLDELERSTSSPERSLVKLIRSLLAIPPDERPKACQVTQQLRVISVKACIDALDEAYVNLVEFIDLFEARVERERFRCWRVVVDSYLDLTGVQSPPPAMYQLNNVDLMLDCLQRSHDEIVFILSRHENMLSPLFTSIRTFNDRLMDLLPSDGKVQARTRLELQLLATDDSNLLLETSKQSENGDIEERIGLLATVKNISLQLNQRNVLSRPDLRENRDSLSLKGSFENHHLAVKTDRETQSESKVLIEWIEYDSYWDGPVSKEMLCRVEAITEMLNSSKIPDEFRTFHCSGFFHESSRHAFGLVYSIPFHDSVQAEPLQNLIDIFRRTKDARERPPLGARFSLAYKIAAAISEFHKIAWVHKSISPYNIVFINKAEEAAASWIDHPYLIGFNHSRPDDPKAFTEGPDLSTKYVPYHHPLYVNQKVRFRPDFDFYSLGIVLVEIGLWKPLNELVSGMQLTSRKSLQAALLEKRVPLLAHVMGVGYRDAVMTCLSEQGGFGVSLDDEWMTEHSKIVNLAFETKVLTLLRKCYA